MFNEFFNKGRNSKKAGEIIYKNEKPKDSETIKMRVRIEGLVQGVGFRYTTKHVADQIGISGIVKNENDGSVYVEALGSSDLIDQFIEELAKGPSPSAHVDKVTVEFDDSIPDYKGFGQRH